MKGLLLKDWYILRNKGKMYFVIIPVYLLIALVQRNSFFLFFCAIFAAMIPRTLASYDEHARWCSYTAALPLSKGQVVLARYIAAMLTLGFTLASICALYLAGAVLLRLPMNLGLTVFLFSFYTALSMPCLYRFGVEKGRMVQTALMLVFMIAAGTVAALAENEDFLMLLHISPDLLLAGLVLLSIGLLAASYFASVKWYRYTPNL